LAQRFTTPIVVQLQLGDKRVPVQIRTNSIMHVIESESSPPQLVEVQWEGRMFLNFAWNSKDTSGPVG